MTQIWQIKATSSSKLAIRWLWTEKQNKQHSQIIVFVWKLLIVYLMMAAFCSKYRWQRFPTSMCTFFEFVLLLLQQTIKWFFMRAANVRSFVLFSNQLDSIHSSESGWVCNYPLAQGHKCPSRLFSRIRSTQLTTSRGVMNIFSTASEYCLKKHILVQ